MKTLRVQKRMARTEPYWEPLLRIFPERQVAEFMFMSEMSCENDIRIFLYKHIFTRHYLNLDNSGQAYAFRIIQGDQYYEPIELKDAIQYALS